MLFQFIFISIQFIFNSCYFNSFSYGIICKDLPEDKKKYIFESLLKLFVKKKCRLSFPSSYYSLYLFRVTLSVISMGENGCFLYCGYRFKYLRK